MIPLFLPSVNGKQFSGFFSQFTLVQPYFTPSLYQLIFSLGILKNDEVDENNLEEELKLTNSNVEESVQSSLTKRV
ncbi:hypothetical protein Avbf_18347 [Armadillidium vulgare]|nr:hypothetical protein Avbf_18347 [Armadillidium vulgare]